jgi:hypothetical protein
MILTIPILGETGAWYRMSEWFKHENYNILKWIKRNTAGKGYYNIQHQCYIFEFDNEEDYKKAKRIIDHENSPERVKRDLIGMTEANKGWYDY